MRTFNLLIITLGIIFSSCSTKHRYCALAYGPITPSIESKVLSLEKIGFSDTVVAHLSGKILGKYLIGNDTIEEHLAFSNVVLIEHASNKRYGAMSNLDGNYKLYVPASKYHLEIQFIGQNTLNIENFELESGEIIELNVSLGQGEATTCCEKYPHQQNQE